MKRLRSELGIAQILISHDVNLVSDTADRVVVMRNGRLTECAASEKVSTEMEHRSAERTVTSDSQPDLVMAEAK